MSNATQVVPEASSEMHVPADFSLHNIDFVSEQGSAKRARFNDGSTGGGSSRPMAMAGQAAMMAPHMPHGAAQWSMMAPMHGQPQGAYGGHQLASMYGMQAPMMRQGSMWSHDAGMMRDGMMIAPTAVAANPHTAYAIYPCRPNSVYDVCFLSALSSSHPTFVPHLCLACSCLSLS